MNRVALLACVLGLGLHPSSAFVAPSGTVATRHSSGGGSAWRTCSEEHDPAVQSPRRSSGMSMLERGAGAEPGAGGRFAKGWKTALTSAAIGLALAGPMLSLPGHAGAAEKRAVGEISASGLVFKDKLNVEAFTDPKVQGVTLYLSDFSRPVADKLMNGDIFSDPSSAALYCVRSGPMEVKDGLNSSKEGEELFKEDRSFFKSIVVRRLYDKEANNIVYVSYSSKLDTGSDGNKSRFKSSLCALHVE